MRIAVIGGGPGGLYFAALAQQLAATTGQRHEITVWERNAADDTFGFGVVFSDETLGGIEHADPAVFARMQREFAIWDDIDVHFKGETITSGGHAFAAMSRRRLLEILQERCRELDVTLHFRTEAPDVDELTASYDLVVAADGLNSAVRQRYADTFRPSLDVRDCRYIWLGTDLVFDAFKFDIRDTPHGVMQIHGYPFDATGSTFIVEMTSEVWRRAGFADFADRDWAPGESDEKSIALIRELFDDILGGHEVMANNSRWISFTTVRNEHWVHAEPGKGAVVILGDAAHTAHFSIGSGTKLAMEDALALAACLHEEPDTSGGARDVRGGAQGRRALHPARGAGQPGVVREPRAVRPPGADAVRLQHHDPVAAGHLRQPAGARPGVRRPVRGLVRRGRPPVVERASAASVSKPPLPRCSSRSPCARQKAPASP